MCLHSGTPTVSCADLMLMMMTSCDSDGGDLHQCRGCDPVRPCALDPCSLSSVSLSLLSLARCSRCRLLFLSLMALCFRHSLGFGWQTCAASPVLTAGRGPATDVQPRAFNFINLSFITFLFLSLYALPLRSFQQAALARTWGATLLRKTRTAHAACRVITEQAHSRQMFCAPAQLHTAAGRSSTLCARQIVNVLLTSAAFTRVGGVRIRALSPHRVATAAAGVVTSGWSTRTATKSLRCHPYVRAEEMPLAPFPRVLKRGCNERERLTTELRSQAISQTHPRKPSCAGDVCVLTEPSASAASPGLWLLQLLHVLTLWTEIVLFSAHGSQDSPPSLDRLQNILFAPTSPCTIRSCLLSRSYRTSTSLCVNSVSDFAGGARKPVSIGPTPSREPKLTPSFDAIASTLPGFGPSELSFTPPIEL